MKKKFERFAPNVYSEKRIISHNGNKCYIVCKSDNEDTMLGYYDVQERQWTNLYDNIEPEQIVVYNDESDKVYVIDVSDGQVCLKFDDDLSWSVDTVSKEEYLIDTTCEEGLLLVKTGYDNEEEQVVRVYLIDVEGKQFYHIRSSVIEKSIGMPYIVKKDNTKLMVLEYAKYAEYEQQEIYDMLGEEEAANEIMYVQVDELISSIRKSQLMEWTCIEKGGQYNSVRILGVEEDCLIIANVNWKEKKTVIKYKGIGGRQEKSICIPACITYYNFIGEKVFISWNEYIDIYNMDGDILYSIDPRKAGEQLELNAVLAVLDNDKIVIDATQIGDEDMQVRVVYDAKKELFHYYNTELLQYGKIVL